MNYRLATIQPEYSLGVKTTETIPLNIQDPISRIEIFHKPTLVQSAMVAALAVCISKIELVDGSDALHSLSGRQNQALCIYDRRVPTMNSGVLSGGAEAMATYGIDFGRFLYDPLLAFDPTRFRNPQLKITHDSTLVDALCGTHTLEVMAHVFDEKVISPIGFLSASEHVSYVAANITAKRDLDMPVDMPLRQMLLRGYFTGQDPKTVIAHLELREDGGKRIPYDVEIDDYIDRMKGHWSQVEEIRADYIDNIGNYYKYCTPTDHWVSVAGMNVGDVNHEASWLSGGCQGGFVRIHNEDTLWMTAMVKGYLPHHCIQFPFGNPQDIDDWYDVTRLNNLKARITSGATVGLGSQIELIIQQLQRY